MASTAAVTLGPLFVCFEHKLCVRAKSTYTSAYTWKQGGLHAVNEAPDIALEVALHGHKLAFLNTELGPDGMIVR